MTRIWTPRADQERVMAFADPRARWGLFAPTGAGKTVMGATWLDAAMNDSFSVSRALIVAPPIPAREGWVGQLRQWAHLAHLARDVRVLGAADLDLEPGTLVSADDEIWEGAWSDLDEITRTYCDVRRTGLQFRDKAATKAHLRTLRERLHLVDWTFFPWLVQAYGSNLPYQAIVFDEASFLRDYASERNKAARHAVLRKGSGVSHVLLLTASPADNHGPAIWPQANIAVPGCLEPTLTAFHDRWCQPDQVNRQTGQVWSWRIVPALRDQLAAQIATWAVAVPDVLEVPLVPVEHRSPLGEAARAAHAAMEEHGVAVIDGVTVAAANSAVAHAKCRQIAAGFCYADGRVEEGGRVLFLDDSRIGAMEEQAETEEGSILVGYNFKEELRRLRKAFGLHVEDIRETGAKAAFEAGKLKILAVHPASAGHGVDGLQHRCSQVWWASVPEDEELHGQLNGRIRRHGTTASTVYAHYWIAEGSREARIYDKNLPDKRREADRLLAAIAV